MSHTRWVVVLLALSGVLVGCGAEPGPSGQPPRLVESLLPAERGSVGVPEDQPAVATALTAALGGDPRFGSVSVDDEGVGLVLYWFGDPPVEELGPIRKAYPDLPVQVRATEVLPEDLRLAARRILDEEDAVTAVEVRPDASGIDVRVDGGRLTETPTELAERLSQEVGHPVDVQEGEVLRFT